MLPGCCWCWWCWWWGTNGCDGCETNGGCTKWWWWCVVCPPIATPPGGIPTPGPCWAGWVRYDGAGCPVKRGPIPTGLPWTTTPPMGCCTCGPPSCGIWLGGDSCGGAEEAPLLVLGVGCCGPLFPPPPTLPAAFGTNGRAPGFIDIGLLRIGFYYFPFFFLFFFSLLGFCCNCLLKQSFLKTPAEKRKSRHQRQQVCVCVYVCVFAPPLFFPPFWLSLIANSIALGKKPTTTLPSFLFFSLKKNIWHRSPNSQGPRSLCWHLSRPSLQGIAAQSRSS